MTILMLVVLVAAAIGVGVWAYATAVSDDDVDRDETAAQRNVTSTDTAPPAHPAEPVPGSDAARHEQGAP
ncbi:MAG: hypothetical protein ACTHN0_12755 [Aquihabitans sp.]